MAALAVLEDLDEIEALGSGVPVAGEPASVDPFEFEGAPEAFHGGVVVAEVPAPHETGTAVASMPIPKGSEFGGDPSRRTRWARPRGCRKASRWNGRTSSHGPVRSVPGRFGEDAQRFFSMSRCSCRWWIPRWAPSSSDWRSWTVGLVAPAATFPPASAGGRSFRQAKSRLSLGPNSLAMTAADQPLDNLLRITSILKGSSNLRRFWAGVSLMMDSMGLVSPLLTVREIEAASSWNPRRSCAILP